MKYTCITSTEGFHCSRDRFCFGGDRFHCQRDRIRFNGGSSLVHRDSTHYCWCGPHFRVSWCHLDMGGLHYRRSNCCFRKGCSHVKQSSHCLCGASYIFHTDSSRVHRVIVYLWCHWSRCPFWNVLMFDWTEALNTLRPKQNGRHFADDIFKRIFLNENVWIPIKISLKFVPKDPINNIPALVQIMAWRRPGDKPLSESMMVSLPMS